MIGGTYYQTLLDAYAALLVDAIVMSQATSFTDGLTLDKNVHILLHGGYNADYSAQTGMTTLQGKLTVEKGSLVVERVVIR